MCPRATFLGSSKHLLVLLAPFARLILDSLEHAECWLCLGATSWGRVPAVAAAMTCNSPLHAESGSRAACTGALHEQALSCCLEATWSMWQALLPQRPGPA